MTSAIDTNVTEPATESAGDWCGADPFAPSFRDDPYPALHGLRERDPVNLTPVGTWRISRYDDVAAIFRTAKTSMTLSNGESPNFDPLDKRGSFLEFMLNKDDPEHLVLRRLATLTLNPKTARMMEDEVKLTVKDAMDEALKRGGMDVVPHMAHNVPSRMVCKIMGIPECDREKFNEWTAARTNAFFAKFLPPEVQQRTRDAGNAMADYFEALMRERRKNLGDDLISTMIRANDSADKLSDDTLVIQAIGIIIAGYETTIGLIGNGMRALLDHPDQTEKLRVQPDLVNNAVNECLRYDTPILFNWRVLQEPFEVGGKTLPADAVIWQMLASANRDPARFENPDVFDIERKDVSHQAFGGGIHHCIGNTLARMEARHAFSEFAQRTKGLRIEQGKLEWSHSFFRVMASLPIAFR
ncbi:cytochrome P450 [Nevskia ramosa]|uniref:cytochrome P450 n=1 Tax=Nevskia ramosa TaxID=64002 RepID=UPI0003B6D219|nr:cytochrome P450 [Nevskia ramosa]